MKQEITSCLTCEHKDICIKRSTTIYALFIQTGRYDDVPAAKQHLDIGIGCEDWEKENPA